MEKLRPYLNIIIVQLTVILLLQLVLLILGIFLIRNMVDTASEASTHPAELALEGSLNASFADGAAPPNFAVPLDNAQPTLAQATLTATPVILTTATAIPPTLAPTRTIQNVSGGNAALSNLGGTSSPTVLPTATLTQAPSLVNEVKPFEASAHVAINVSANQHPISPYIYGLAGGGGAYLDDLRPTLQSWGGNPSSRYNWRLGDAWNTGVDNNFRNTNYANSAGSAADRFLSQLMTLGIDARLTVPMVGWVAKDTSEQTCSFKDEVGRCIVPEGMDCATQTVVADPSATSVRSTPADIAAWMQHLKDSGVNVRFIGLGNEPELWGYTHYDVHPNCSTYQELFDTTVAYAQAIRQVFPRAELAAPNVCCWHFYWQSAAGYLDKQSNGDQEYLPWFLDQMRLHEEATGERLMDVLDVHYYPAGLFDKPAESPHAEHRLRATASLWDPTYVDESWIGEPVYLIPRMKQLIADHYPGTKFGISEWNFGAEDTLNGAVAIADVLGIFGRESLYYATYWQQPPYQSPAYYAFKLYTNYDSNGGRFGDVSISADSDDNSISTYAAIDSSSGNLHIMLLNKNSADSAAVAVDLGGFAAQGNYSSYTVDNSADNIQTATGTVQGGNGLQVQLAPYAITHIVLEGQ